MEQPVQMELTEQQVQQVHKEMQDHKESKAKKEIQEQPVQMEMTEQQDLQDQ